MVNSTINLGYVSMIASRQRFLQDTLTKIIKNSTDLTGQFFKDANTNYENV